MVSSHRPVDMTGGPSFRPLSPSSNHSASNHSVGNYSMSNHSVANSSVGYISVPTRKSRLRRPPKLPVPTHIIPIHKNPLAVLGSLLCCITFVTVIPVYILSSVEDPEHHPRAVHGVHKLMDMAHSFQRKMHLHLIPDAEEEYHEDVLGISDHDVDSSFKDNAFQNLQQQQQVVQFLPEEKERLPTTGDANNLFPHPPGKPKLKKQQPPGKAGHKKQGGNRKQKKMRQESLADKQVKPHYTLNDLQDAANPEFDVDWRQKPVARRLTGSDPSPTPSLNGAQRAHIANCELNVDSLAYWNDPVGELDRNFVSPFANHRSPEKEQFITFSPDRGGWNNVRMSMEILFVLAAVTGRTLVLPPKEPLYLLNKDRKEKFRGFVDFFPLSDQDRPESFPVKIMSMEEFLQTPLQQHQLSEPRYQANRTLIEQAAPFCDKRKKAKEQPCDPLYDYLTQVGHNPKLSARNTCLLFDVDAAKDGGVPSEEARAVQAKYCGARAPVYWSHETFMKYDHLHLPAHHKDFRLLTHFYNFFYFSDPTHSHHYKRFVRDYLHYNDVIFCAAGKVLRAVQKEALERGFALDDAGGGGFSSLHIRRGDLQYKKVKISAQEWHDNTKELWQDKELLYVATDERNMTFFDDLAKHYELRFLEDYWDLADLGSLDPNYMGMIDTIVASRGRVFAGTWFSTFTGYINRMRGYHGMSMHDSWYSFLPKKNAMQTWEIMTHYSFAFEWPDGWVGIDGDVWPERDKF